MPRIGWVRLSHKVRPNHPQMPIIFCGDAIAMRDAAADAEREAELTHEAER